MRSIVWVLVVVLSFALLEGCGQTVVAPDSLMGLGESISEKTPKLPTTFVDTTGGQYGWDKMYNPVQSLQNRIAPPKGFVRKPFEKGSFGAWLRGLPLKPGKPQVMLYNGQPKQNQDAQFAVLNLDVGKRDLQQCADAVMRLRGEYLFSQGRHDEIHFKFTNGEDCPWSKWKTGLRPVIGGAKTSWQQRAAASASHENFRAYMDLVFTYAGTHSLEKELVKVASFSELQVGDVFIQGGFPGHAVIVLDVVENPDNGTRKYMLAQSYMPAQDMHILINPNDPQYAPWYDASSKDHVYTPEWTFLQKDLKRFAGE